MWKLIRRSVLAHKVRFFLTAFSIVLGVGFVASTFIYTDTINAAFSGIFDDAFAGIDVQVSSESEFTLADPPLIDESVTDVVAAVPGVDRAIPSLTRIGIQFVDDEGEPVSSGGAPNIGGYFPADVGMGFAGIEIESPGGPPTGPGEVLIDAGTADDLDLEVGDTVDVVSTIRQAAPYTVVGIVTFGGLDSLGGSTFALFDLPTAQSLIGAEGQIDGVSVLATPGTNAEQLVADIQAVLPSGTIAQSAQDAAEADAAETQEALAFFGTFLSIFGFVALFVGTFIIANTFRIIVAQRTRELALLRALGATARQIRQLVIGEALLVGVAASISGVVAGMFLAVVLQQVLDAAGVTLPTTTLRLQPRTVILALLVGVVVTIISAWLPARRAARISPMEALHERESTIGSLRTRGIAGTTVMSAGFLLLILGLFTDVEAGPVSSILLVGLGAAIILIAVTILAPLIARPVLRVLGPVVRFATRFIFQPLLFPLAVLTIQVWLPYYLVWNAGARDWRRPMDFYEQRVRATEPLRRAISWLAMAARSVLWVAALVVSWLWALPYAVYRLVTNKVSWSELWAPLIGFWRNEFRSYWRRATHQTTGTIAQQNARKTPRRTSATAGAIMIGIALVTLAAVLAASIQGLVDNLIDDGIDADLIVQPENPFQFTSFSPELADRIADDAAVADSTTLRQGLAIVDETEVFIAGVEDNFSEFVAFDSLEGRFDLGPTSVALDKATADDAGYSLGTTIAMTFPDGTIEMLTLDAIYESPGAAGYAVSLETFAARNPSAGDSQIYIRLLPDQDLLATQERLIDLAADIPSAAILTLDELRSQIEDQINGLLGFIFGLLGLAVIISLFGVTNTMTLSVFERTHEIGLLRAVGMTRQQTRRMIRGEASIISVFGAILGVLVGILFGWALIRALADQGFDTFVIPGVTLTIWIAGIGIAGVIFALIPAWRASRLNVLEAISYE